MGSQLLIAATIREQGRRKSWVAYRMGISPSYLTRLLNGERPWLPYLRERIARVLAVPESVLFPASNCDSTDTNSPVEGAANGGLEVM